MIRKSLLSNSKPACVKVSQPETEGQKSDLIKKALLKGINLKAGHSFEGKENNAGKIEKKYARRQR